MTREEAEGSTELALAMVNALSDIALGFPQRLVACALIRTVGAMIPNCAAGAKPGDALREVAESMLRLAQSRD